MFYLDERFNLEEFVLYLDKTFNAVHVHACLSFLRVCVKDNLPARGVGKYVDRV